MEGKRLPDVAWHIGFLHKKEDDKRRHKSRCIYNNGKECKNVYMMTCCGSAHCQFYKEKPNINKTEHYDTVVETKITKKNKDNKRYKFEYAKSSELVSYIEKNFSPAENSFLSKVLKKHKKQNRKQNVLDKLNKTSLYFNDFVCYIQSLTDNDKIKFVSDFYEKTVDNLEYSRLYRKIHNAKTKPNYCCEKFFNKLNSKMNKEDLCVKYFIHFWKTK